MDGQQVVHGRTEVFLGLVSDAGNQAYSPGVRHRPDAPEGPESGSARIVGWSRSMAQAPDEDPMNRRLVLLTALTVTAIAAGPVVAAGTHGQALIAVTDRAPGS